MSGFNLILAQQPRAKPEHYSKIIKSKFIMFKRIIGEFK